LTGLVEALIFNHRGDRATERRWGKGLNSSSVESGERKVTPRVDPEPKTRQDFCARARAALIPIFPSRAFALRRKLRAIRIVLFRARERASRGRRRKTRGRRSPFAGRESSRMIRGIMACIAAEIIPRVISLRSIDRSPRPINPRGPLILAAALLPPLPLHPLARDSIWTTSDPLHFPHLLPVVTDGPGRARAAHTEVPHMVDAAAATAAAAAAAAKLAVISVRQQSWLTG